jgi:hypothetical protein
MLSYLTDSVYYYLGYEEEIKPDPKTLRVRNEMLKQIRLSKLELKPIYKKQPLIQVKPIVFKNKKKKTKKRNNSVNK